MLKIKMFCPTCKRPYEINAPFGFSLREPTIDVDGDLSIPVTPPALEEISEDDGPQVNQVADNKVIN